MKRIVLSLPILLVSIGLCAQLEPGKHKDALEGIYVEPYYISDANDASDEDGGSLIENSVTYRIFADLAEGYELQMVFSFDTHDLLIESTDEFFNNEDRGEELGSSIASRFLSDNTIALDSWVTIGASTDEYVAVPKYLDPDGSVVGGSNNDGGSEGVSGGLISNEHPKAGIPVTVSDGLVAGTPLETVTIGMDGALGSFADANSSEDFLTNSGIWNVLGGERGATAENMVILGQFTTAGTLHCKLNLQVRTQKQPFEVIRYVHTTHPEDSTEGARTEVYYYEYPDLEFSINIDSLTLSAETKNSDSPFRIFPNPASDFINIQLPSSTFGNKSEITIFNSLGVTLINEVLQKDIQYKSFDLTGFEEGVYFIRLNSKDYVYTNTFMISN